jgi:Xaa-Pro dipeptidase
MGALYDDDGETTCYGPIVAAGFRSGAPHSTFVGRRLRPGEPVFLELTGVVHRYTSPAMKTVIIGEPTREMLEISDRGGAALRNILEIARPGVTAVDVANRTIDVLGPILDGRLFHYRP